MSVKLWPNYYHGAEGSYSTPRPQGARLRREGGCPWKSVHVARPYARLASLHTSRDSLPSSLATPSFERQDGRCSSLELYFVHPTPGRSIWGRDRGLGRWVGLALSCQYLILRRLKASPRVLRSCRDSVGKSCTHAYLYTYLFTRGSYNGESDFNEISTRNPARIE